MINWSIMAGLEDPSVSYEETKYRAKVELHDLSEECLIERKYMGTDSDRHDMVVLGRKQVLRVRKDTLIPCASEIILGKSPGTTLKTPSAAQLSIPVNGGLCHRPHLYLGASLRVRELPHGIDLMSSLNRSCWAATSYSV